MHYTKDKTQEILFPVGGIGTGSVSFAGNSHLRDWEIFNRPSKGSENGYSHLALRMKTASGVRAIILNGDQQTDLMGQRGSRTFWSVDGAWGTAELCKDRAVLTVTEGTLRANCLKLPFLKAVSKVTVNGKPAAFRTENGTVVLDASALSGTIVIEG